MAMARYAPELAWRDTALRPRLGPFDARCAYFLLAAGMHLNGFTAALAVAASLFFWLIERLGYPVEVLFRGWRRRFLRERRPAIDSRQWRRNLKC